MSDLHDTLLRLAQTDHDSPISDVVVDLERRLADPAERASAPARTAVRVLDRFGGRRHEPRYAALTVGISIVVVAVALPSVLIGLWLATDDTLGSTPPASVVSDAPVPAAEPFDLDTDTLCSWFTAAQMDDLLARAQVAAGTSLVVDPFPPDRCSTQSPYNFSMWANARWFANLYDEGGIAISLSRPTNGVVPISVPREGFIPDDLLDPSVTYKVERYRVAYDAGVTLYLLVEGHDGPIQVSVGIGGDTWARGTPKYEDLGLAVAEEMLEAMHWVGADNEPTKGTTQPAREGSEP